ncbi:MAG: endolytic transglycosylase MltG [Candidatus Moranbacteria bacterium]|nr:endolytic transglycosylase MltG [Candidatus Moranbacteria bacterium]
MKYFLLVAFLITVSVVGLTMRLEYQVSHATGTNKDVQTFTVTPGVGVMALGEELEQKEIISSKYAFGWAVATKRLSHKLIAGDYELSGDQSIEQILMLFNTGKVVSTDIKVTFPEGWTMTFMAERLTKNGLPGEEFLALASKPDPKWRAKYDFLADAPAKATLEGFLFPDTYRFRADVSAEEIIDTMLANFNKRLTPELRASAKAQGRSIFEEITLASIVEEEGRIEEDRKIIADIFWKRLKAGQPFQSDATVNYVLGSLKEQPTLKDIETDSPYNTYKYAGLPPGPITNPSIISIKAAINPTPNPYYYFLNNLETKEMYFAKTFEEHVENRRIHGL